MFGPLITATFFASSGKAGSSIALSSVLKLPGTGTFILFMPRVLGSVITPVSAEAQAVSGETRYTFASLVPLLPSKFLLNDLKLIPPEFGEKPIPIQGPQPHSRSLAPDARISLSAPQSESMESTCFEPQETDMLTLSEIFLPFSILAHLSISLKEEFVHDPMHTWSILIPDTSLTLTTLSGWCGQAIIGSSSDKLIVMISEYLASSSASQRTKSFSLP